jgi:dsRNA-specific ribonuclease
VFEALLAAVFFDSDNSLEIAWRVIEPFIGKFLGMKECLFRMREKSFSDFQIDRLLILI